jgi:hypothetical protein
MGDWLFYDTSNSGLPDDYVIGVTFDAHGNLWNGTGMAHNSGRSTGGVAVYREGGVIPQSLGAEFARLTSATTLLGDTRVGQPMPLEFTVVFDKPLDAGKTLLVILDPLGSDLPLENAGGGRYTVSTTTTPLRNAHYDLPVVIQTAEGLRHRFYLATLNVYPDGDLIIYDDVPGEGWAVKGAIGESNLTDTTFVHSGKYSYVIGPGKALVKFLCNDPKGINLFGYSHLEFYINGGNGTGQNPKVGYTSLKALGIEPVANTWTQVSISTLSLRNPLRIIDFWGSGEEPFYIDDIRLVVGELKNKIK